MNENESMGCVVSVFGVQPLRIGGTETYARELSKQLAQQEYRSVLCFETEPGENVRNFLSLPNVTLETLPLEGSGRLRTALRLRKILKRHRAGLLHLHFTGFLSIYPWLAYFSGVEKVFFTDHSSRPSGYVTHRAAAWKRLLARVVNLPIDKVICVSEYGLKCLTALDLLRRDKFELVYNAVDLTRVSRDQELGKKFRRQYQIPEDRVLALQVSWMIPEKGILDLLNAARIVVERNPNVHFALIGDGPYRQEFMKHADELGIGGNVTWTGLINDPFSEGVYQAADIVCQASRWEELFGWMIAEAMAYQRPVVATRAGGIPELVSEAETGYLVDRNDIESLAKRILELASNQELRARLGSAGAGVVRTKFSLADNVAKLIKLYSVQNRER
jgi:glycosyltransferase involved in cell wall biosynthesis